MNQRRFVALCVLSRYGRDPAKGVFALNDEPLEAQTNSRNLHENESFEEELPQYSLHVTGLTQSMTNPAPIYPHFLLHSLYLLAQYGC